MGTVLTLEKTETKTACIFKDKNGVVHVILSPATKIDYYDALDHYLVVKSLSASKPVLKLIDTRANWAIHSKARKFLADKENKQRTIALAVLQKSYLKSVLLNFINRIKSPEVPIRVFTDYDKAYSWLMAMNWKK